jgi:hypothetical protein
VFKLKDPVSFFRLVPHFVWILCMLIVSGILIVSHAAIMQNRHPHFRSGMFVLAGVLIGFLIAGMGKREYWIYRLFDPLTHSQKYIWVFLVGLIISVLVSRLDEMSEFKDFFEHHGSLFDWVMGSLTVVGIWLTYSTITESQSIIRSFSQLQSRIIKMAGDTDKNEKLKILAYTASLGFLALKPEEWQALDEALAGLANRLHIICLNDDDLQLWHNQFIGRNAAGGRTIRLDHAIDATDASHVRTSLRNCAVKLKSEQMPGYYLIYNPRRAIIITPFFVPQYPITVTTRIDPANISRVQMFGFETTDQRVIEDVSALFEYYWNNRDFRLPFSPSAGGTTGKAAEALGAALEAAVKAVPADSYYRYRSLIAEEKITGSVILDFLRARRSSEAHNFEKAESTWRSGKLYLQCQTTEQKDWIDTQCRKLLNEAKEKLQLDIEIEVEVKPKP